MDILDRVRKAAKKRILFLPHAVRQMSHPDRMISIQEVRSVINTDVVIEDYPEDARGQSCLILGPFGLFSAPPGRGKKFCKNQGSSPVWFWFIQVMIWRF